MGITAVNKWKTWSCKGQSGAVEQRVSTSSKVLGSILLWVKWLKVGQTELSSRMLLSVIHAPTINNFSSLALYASQYGIMTNFMCTKCPLVAKV